MIAFDLQCNNGHSFEGWFEDGKAYEDQKKRKLIACPVCNSTDVSKILSTFAIKRTSDFDPNAPASQDKIEDLSKKIVDFVEKNFDNVGSDFAKEALKIHYGVTEPRNIRGVSSPEEEKVLKQEGIQYYKIPVPPPQDTDN
jgi:hypothetical protein